MTLDLAGYTVATNQPLNHARILWSPITGTIVADGTLGDLVANDYTSQRWVLAAGANDWVLTATSAADMDTVFISAHNLTGRTVTISTSPDLVTAYTLRATIAVPDNSTIAAMFNTGAGALVSAQRVKISVSEGTGNVVGIIRAGAALQMTQPFYAGFAPTHLNRITEGNSHSLKLGNGLGALKSALP